jgi:glycosyltransferase involved in cell wall biosynthesis
MRIAMMGSRGIPARYGGSETAIEEIGERLVQHGHEVVAYCRRHNSNTDEKFFKGIERVVLPSINTKNLDTPTHTLLSTLHALLFRRPDVIHFHGVGNAIVLPLLKLTRVKSVITIDGPDWERPKWGPLASLVLKISARMAARLSDALIIDNRIAQRYFAEHFGTTSAYVPYGAYLEPEEDTDELERLGFEERRYILFVGRLIPDKGVHLLVKAFEGLKTDMKLAIVGDNPYFPDYIRRLKSTTDPRIKFLGYVFGRPYRQLCSHAYVYAHPLLVDGTSPALLQAMGFGNCILSSAVPEALDVIGDAGFSFRYDDAEDLRRMLQKLIDDPALVEQARHKARQRVAELFNWDRVTAEHEQVYQAALGQGALPQTDESASLKMESPSR